MKTLSEIKKASIAPPVVSGGLPLLGHAIGFMRDPHKVIRRGYEEHGLIFTLDLGLRKAHVLLGPENHKFSLRADYT
jgi:sterol 14-demethylase